jgi:hypothetical protein
MRFAIADLAAQMLMARLARADAPNQSCGEARFAGFEDFRNSRNAGSGRATYFSFEA